MDIPAFIFLGVVAIFGFTLLLIIPGFLLSLVFFPRLSDLRLMERLAYSTVLSIGSVLFLVLFMDLVLGIYTTQKNIFLGVICYSIFLTSLWLVRRFWLSSSLTEKISDRMTRIKIIYISPLKTRLKEILERIKIA